MAISIILFQESLWYLLGGWRYTLQKRSETASCTKVANQWHFGTTKPNTCKYNTVNYLWLYILINFSRLELFTEKQAMTSRNNWFSWSNNAIPLISRVSYIRYSISNTKYNNTKRSIPMNPKFVNNAHRNLHLWPPKSIELILLAWLTCLPSLMNQSCQKDNIARWRQPYVNSNKK